MWFPVHFRFFRTHRAFPTEMTYWNMFRFGRPSGNNAAATAQNKRIGRSKKIEKLSRGTRERAESGRLLCLNQVKVTSSNTDFSLNTTDRACHCLHTTRRYRHKTEQKVLLPITAARFFLPDGVFLHYCAHGLDFCTSAYVRIQSINKKLLQLH